MVQHSTRQPAAYSSPRGHGTVTLNYSFHTSECHFSPPRKQLRFQPRMPASQIFAQSRKTLTRVYSQFHFVLPPKNHMTSTHSQCGTVIYIYIYRVTASGSVSFPFHALILLSFETKTITAPRHSSCNATCSTSAHWLHIQCLRITL
jgi:hypothetical protein